jgi:hypothetical protein
MAGLALMRIEAKGRKNLRIGKNGNWARMFRRFFSELTSFICEKFHKLTKTLKLLVFFGVQMVRVCEIKRFLGKKCTVTQ